MRLTYLVIERILDDPRLDGACITVEVQYGVVSLIGTVGSLDARIAAAELARSTPGVADICNRLELARSADITTAMEDLRPDPFDELVAQWDDSQEHLPPRYGRCLKTRLLGAAASLFLLAAALLWILLLPRFGGAALLIIVPCVAFAGLLALLARPSTDGS
ncbi:BON domain-containing protein [Actinoplanes sp. NPDC049668]|uniref:BON domain-containing protein n=1 Tax=unclassified Actinoplanes TaxID=2626549 RepID=UPI0033A46579